MALNEHMKIQYDWVTDISIGVRAASLDKKEWKEWLRSRG